MNIYKVTITLPYLYNLSEEVEAKRKVAIEEAEKFLAELKGCTQWEESSIYLVEEYALPSIIKRFPLKERYESDKVRIEDMEVAMTCDSTEVMFRELIQRMENNLAHLNQHGMGDGPDTGWNNKCGTPVSGPNLHGVNRLMLAEDYCTDALQSRLDEGWRILAVCPQEQRRPDYVLGRMILESGYSGRAERG